MKTFKKGGIHPAEDKLTSECPVVELQLPAKVTLILAQSIGSPPKCIVKVKDTVERGQLIAEASSFVSANLHSPIPGTVTRIEKVRNERGLWQEAVTIEQDKDKIHLFEEANGIKYEGSDIFPSEIDNLHFPLIPESELENLTPSDIVARVRDAGVVGLGGATFPTHVKLTVPEGKCVDTVLINGAECEPYLTCDDRLMQERPKEIIAGVKFLMKAVDATKAIVGIESNKPEAYAAMRDAAGESGISVVLLKKKYPQGSEKQLIEALTGRRVPPGALPVDVGTLVDNVATAFVVYEAVARRKPLMERVATVTGKELKAGNNFLVQNGVSIDALLQLCGGIPEGTEKIISGGPMMGRAVSQILAPSTKGTGGITVMSGEEAKRPEVKPCIRCAKCVEACPMGLEPYLLARMAAHKMWEETRENYIMACLECGCCSYICPSSRPLLDYIKLARQELRRMK